MIFFVFCEFLLNEKSEVKFFRLKRSALKRGIQRCRIHCHIMFNKGSYGRLNVFSGCKFDRRGGYVVISKKIFVADSNEIAVSYCLG
jgi:hypothetical protein